MDKADVGAESSILCARFELETPKMAPTGVTPYHWLSGKELVTFPNMPFVDFESI